ncbi:50S ribosomal protein L21 [Candidatus Collierbacteria bacterium]|nr:50S ribosomal protein L21 [Candidatus Collierbacteria bacterium]
MKYAIIKAGGIQYQVSKGQGIDIFHLDKVKDDEIVFDSVLLIKDEDKVIVGQPVVKGAKVKGKVVGQILGDKIRVATYKAKSRYRKVKGHRDQLTRVLIENIDVKE